MPKEIGLAYVSRVARYLQRNIAEMAHVGLARDLAVRDGGETVNLAGGNFSRKEAQEAQKQ